MLSVIQIQSSFPSKPTYFLEFTMLAEDAGEDLIIDKSFTAHLKTICEKHSEKVALVCRHQPADFLYQNSNNEGTPHVCLRWTYAQFHEASSTLAAQWHSNGIRKGMRIATFLHGCTEWAVAFYAAALLGCALVSINPAMASKRDDVQHMLGLADVSAIIVWDAKMASDLEEAAGANYLDECLLRLVAGRSDAEIPKGWAYLEHLMRRNVERPTFSSLDLEEPTPDDLLLVIFTSGTTSRPKGVRQTHRSWLAGSISSSIAKQSGSKRECNHLPLFHSFGILTLCTAWTTGAPVCIPSATFEPNASLRAVEEEKLSMISGSPAMMLALINHPSRPTTNLSSLDFIVVGSAMIPPTLIKGLAEGLQCRKVACGFGMSEGLPSVSVHYTDLPYAYDGMFVTSGKATPGTRVRICAPNSRQILERGETGELHTGGPQIADGYLGGVQGYFYNEKGTRWIATGDQAHMNEHGDVFILGRYKDVVIRGGENIAPASIEAVIDSLPGITSQIVGVPDEIAGEVPVAILKKTQDVNFEQDTLQELVGERLSNIYKPSHNIMLEDLQLEEFPKTATGKIQKVELKRLATEYIAKLESGQVEETRERALQSIWSRLLGISASKLTQTTSVQDLADSITIMRGLSKINREFGVGLTAPDLSNAPTIGEQISLVQSRVRSSKAGGQAPSLHETREGPPQASDIAVIAGSQETTDLIKEAFQHVTAPMSLNWEEDVEDVVPIWDWGQIMLTRRRDQSYNNLHAYAVNKASSKDLRAAIEKALLRQPMLRALALQLEEMAPVHAVIRPTQKWFDLAITEVEQVESMSDLSRLAQDDPIINFAAAPGPLYRLIIAPIAETGGSGLVGIAQHSCLDAITLTSFIEDVKADLDGVQITNLAPGVPYKFWADNYFLHRNSALAQSDLDFHAKRLQGIGKLTSCLWPAQRAPEWFTGNDVGSDLQRKPLDGEASTGVDGVSGQIELACIDKLRKNHGLGASTVLKTALALLNVHFTRDKHAIFASHQAGRDWPFQQDFVTDKLPNAMDVNGPTLELVVNKIEIVTKETCGQLLTRIEAEQKLLSKHAHAPVFELQRRLGDEDGAGLIDSIMRRQVFNLAPSSNVASNEEESSLRKIMVQSRSDLGVHWNCRMVDQTFHVNAIYDDAQLSAVEVREAVKRFCAIAGWLADMANLDKPVGECLASQMDNVR